MSASSCSGGMCPASELGVALTITMTFIVEAPVDWWVVLPSVLAFHALVDQRRPQSTSSGKNGASDSSIPVIMGDDDERLGGVSKVEMETPMVLIYKALFPSLSPCETSPSHEA
jgi:hypothetical protein